jgi:hypothetical protein
LNKEDYGTGGGKEGRRMKNEKRNTKQREEEVDEGEGES